MENLFNLIMENFWIVLILFGVFSSMFGSENKKKKSKTFSETTQMPRTAPSTEVENNPKPESWTKVQMPKAKQQAEIKQTVQQETSEAQTYLAEKQKDWKRQAEQLRVQAEKSAVQKAEQQASPKGTFSQNELVNGIIMSEILGAPRSKKSYWQTRR